MSLFTVTVLVAAGVAPTQTRTFADPLNSACAQFDIATPARCAAFIGQCVAESAAFQHLEENLYSSTPERVRQIFPSRVPSLADAARLVRNPQALANRVYAHRLGNGDEATGDGWRYRGRGIVQLTGRANYADAAEALGVDYLAQPDLVAQPVDACLTAAWYWHSAKLNVLADSSQIDAITRAINGAAMLHRDQRRQYTAEALQALQTALG